MSNPQRMPTEQLRELVGKRVVSIRNYGSEVGANDLNVPEGSVGTITGYYTDLGGGCRIRWDPPAVWGPRNGEVANWGIPSPDGWRLLVHHCANCDSEAQEDDYLCKACRVHP